MGSLTGMTSVGVCFPREFPAAWVTTAARSVEAMGADDLWIIEDCFYTGGVSLAAAALASTDRIRVGLGILPAVARNPAITAMELATLAGLAPGRVIGGIGHGVQSWMDQIGERTPSPLATLREVLDAVRALLRGEQVTVEGHRVRLRDVRLEAPPSPVPPVLAEYPGPDYVRWAREQAAANGPFEVAAFAVAHLDTDRQRARERMAPDVLRAVTGGLVPVRALPFYDDLAAGIAARGLDAVLAAPDDWWTHLGAIGTPDDAAAHLHALADAGVDRVALFFPPDQAGWQGQLDLLRDELLPRLTGLTGLSR